MRWLKHYTLRGLFVAVTAQAMMLATWNMTYEVLREGYTNYTSLDASNRSLGQLVLLMRPCDVPSPPSG